jgi:hypothetical protein
MRSEKIRHGYVNKMKTKRTKREKSGSWEEF